MHALAQSKVMFNIWLHAALHTLRQSAFSIGCLKNLRVIDGLRVNDRNMIICFMLACILKIKSIAFYYTHTHTYTHTCLQNINRGLGLMQAAERDTLDANSAANALEAAAK